ncbi:autotransporter outer membrane beta-barrel domain-containing protein [Pseudomonas farris]
MNVFGELPVSPVLKSVVGVLVFIPAFSLSSTGAQAAIIVDNTTLDIDSTTTPFDYLVRNSGVLNVNDAITQSITAQSGSTLNINGATIVGNSGVAGVEITSSRGTIDRADVISDDIGLAVNRSSVAAGGSTVTVSNSQIRGEPVGAQVTGLSSLSLINTQVTGAAGNGIGVNILGGEVNASARTHITGQATGVRMVNDFGNVGTRALSLDNAVVQGVNGSAILVEQGTEATIRVSNGSSLLAGNNILLDVQGASTAAMTVANSTLQGNINIAGNSTANLTFDQGHMTGDVVLVDDPSTATVTLQNNSTFTGRLDQVNGVTINSGSTVTLTGNDTIGALAMGGGNLKFGPDDQPDTFYQLNVGTLVGNPGTNLIMMKGNFASAQHDFLNVTGVATGDFGLAVSASGLDAVSPLALTLVRTGSGHAQFSLVSGPVALGAWSYQLASRSDGEATEWYLDPTTKTVSPGARSVLALFNAPATILYAEGATLRSRMGELRFNGGDSGFWMRTYGNKYNVTDGSGVAYQQTQQGLSLGADVRLGDSQWLAGVMTGYSHSDLNIEQGTSGTIKSYYLGPYVTWLDDESGYYFDALLKFNRFHNDAKVGMSDGTRAKGDYTSNGVSASAEFGRHIKLDQSYFIEPYGKLTTAVIQGKNYDLDNGMHADGDRTRSALAEAGMTVGRNFALGNGRVAQPYVRAAVLHEFINNNRVTVNENNVFNNDLSGTRGQFGVGVALALSKEFQVHADFDYAKGEHIEQPYGVNVGLRWAW